MATERVGLYRKYHGPVPCDESNHPLPKEKWLDKRPFSWAVRWFGLDGNRYSKSFRTRKEADRFAEAKQSEVRAGKGDPPPRMTLRQYYKEHRELMKGNLSPRTLHNLLRHFKTLCKKAGVGPYTIHDLRRSCITNWAKHLPIHVVQQLAGHSDIKTTQQYYLSVRPDDIAHAQRVQEKLIGPILAAGPTDPKLTHSAPKRHFPGRKAKPACFEVPPE